MYTLKAGIKSDPRRRWALPDRIFFGHGACHILAGAFLQKPPIAGFYAERIIPGEEFAGNHIYVTDGVIAFDYHGYSSRLRLLQHHALGWVRRSQPGWNYSLETVDFDLLSTVDLNKRKMLGPDQYWGEALLRAHAFLSQKDHATAAQKARDTKC